jgi:primosomal protein N' (replication factor Y)
VTNEYAEVSLPVPLDRTFTYALPLTLRHRAKTGARLLVPFGARKLTGVIVALQDDPPEHATREALRLLDEEPVLDAPLIALGRWIAGYYCCPLGDVFRSMLPLAAEIRAGKVYSLTDSGRDAARQLLLEASSDDAAAQILALLERRSLSASYLKTKFPLAAGVVRALEKKGFIAVEEVQSDRDPLRAPSAHLRVEAMPHEAPPKLPKAERELLAFLDLHPGSHNLEELESTVKNASQAARSLGRKNLLSITREPLTVMGIVERPPHLLNAAQQTAVDAIREAVQAHAFRTFLIHGVTGSGKTEVYLTAIDAALAAGRSALLLVPEIALTPAVAGQFFNRFGQRVAILHSAFSDAERAEQWRRISTGKAEVVVGTRSGVFAPIRNLGLIIIDEEHDGSYKQEENPRYNGRDTAIVRAQHANACVVLGSATPSLESRYNAERGKYTLLTLPDRIQKRPMPRVDLIDMRQEFLDTRKQATFSRALVEAVTERLKSGEQTMILLNRRGYSSFIACRACGYRVECVNCSITLTFHRRDRRLLCHMCNYACKVPETCPQCESEHIYFLGTGSERVEDELHTQFPEARIARLDRDTVTGKKHYEQILQGFREKSFDLLVGTQMIAKGHDIPNVTLVGVVSADVGLGMPDFRAAERTFQLLTQVAGRAGRGDLPGIVLVQTINPDHYAVRMAAAHDYESFYEKELQFRRLMHYPPFTAMANLLVRAPMQEDALRMATELDAFLKPAPEDIKIMGPAEAPVLRIKAEFRYQFLIKAMKRKTLNALLRRAREFATTQKWGATALVIDVDPLTLT